MKGHSSQDPRRSTAGSRATSKRISELAKRGFVLFNNKAICFACHWAAGASPTTSFTTLALQRKISAAATSLRKSSKCSTRSRRQRCDPSPCARPMSPRLFGEPRRSREALRKRRPGPAQPLAAHGADRTERAGPARSRAPSWRRCPVSRGRTGPPTSDRTRAGFCAHPIYASGNRGPFGSCAAA